MQDKIVFNGIIEINGANPYVLVDKEKANRLKPNWKKPMPVVIQINGRPDDPWKINMMPKGDGNFYLYLHNDVRKASGTRVGDTASVYIRFDDRYVNGPVDVVPNELKVAIDGEKALEKNWNKLSPSRKKEILRYLGRIKSPEVLSENIRTLIPLLKGKDGHYMGRDWRNSK